MAEKEKTHEKADGQKEQEDRKVAEKSLEEEKQKILELSQISLWLDTYDDIFSDFDPRPYSQRSLSDDFLAEAKKASRDKAGKLELRLLVPEAQRDLKSEAVIKKRLHDHFHKHTRIIYNEVKDTRKKAVMMIFLGVSLMLIATYVSSFKLDSTLLKFISNFIFVLLEPTGWFMTWFAFDRFFHAAELKKTEYNFNEKMSRCEIIFSSY